MIAPAFVSLRNTCDVGEWPVRLHGSAGNGASPRTPVSVVKMEHGGEVALGARLNVRSIAQTCVGCYTRVQAHAGPEGEQYRVNGRVKHGRANMN